MESEARSQPQDFLVGGNYILRKREVIYNLPQDSSQGREIIDHRIIEATRDGVSAWRQSKTSWGPRNQTASTPRWTLFGPGELQLTHEAPYSSRPHGRAYLLEVKFPRALKNHEQADFTVRMTQSVDYSQLVMKRHRDKWRITPVIQVDSYRLSIRFPPNDRPREVWHFENLPDALVPGVATEANRLEPDASGFVTFHWQHLAIGYSHGLAWEW